MWADPRPVKARRARGGISQGRGVGPSPLHWHGGERKDPRHTRPWQGREGSRSTDARVWHEGMLLLLLLNSFTIA